MSGVPPDYVMPDYRMTVRFVFDKLGYAPASLDQSNVGLIFAWADLAQGQLHISGEGGYAGRALVLTKTVTGMA